MKFSEKLLSLRKQKGMSQEELADKLNVTRQTVSKWELDQTVPDMNKLVEISKLFEISLDELTGGMNMNNYINEYKTEYTNEYKETAHEKKNKKIALKVFIGGLIISLIICGIGLFKQIDAKNKDKKAADEALKLSEQKVEQAKNRLQEIETQYNEVKAQYDAKVEECDSIKFGSDGWVEKTSKCQREKLELYEQMSNLEMSATSIQNADYTVYYQLVDPFSYKIFYYIGAGTLGGFILISLIFYLATRKK